MKKSRLFNGLTDVEYEEAISRLAPQEIEVEPGEVLVCENKVIHNFWYVKSGKIVGARFHEGGLTDLLQMYTAGDIVGLDVICTRTKRSPMRLTGMVSSKLVEISENMLDNKLFDQTTYGKIQTNIIRWLADESIRKQYKIDVLYQKSLRAKIITFFRHMRDKAGDERFDINMDREQFAQYLGVNRSALSHELSLMRKDGIIKFKKSSFILIDDLMSDDEE